EPSALFDRDDRTDSFYSQAWLFSHFLMLADNSKRRPLLLKFLQVYRTESGEAAVSAAFGAGLTDIERDFKSYVGQRSYSYISLPVKPAPDPPALQPAPPALVEAALGFLALGARHDDLARAHAEKAIALNAKAPDGHAVLAYLALQNQNFDEAESH